MSRIPPDLTHMPPHIKQMIVNDSDTETKLRQRELSQEFKSAVCKAPNRYSGLKMVIWSEKVQLTREKLPWTNELVFTTPKDKSNGVSESVPVQTQEKKVYFMRNNKVNFEKTKEGDYRKAAVAKFLSVFKHSKDSVKRLNIEARPGAQENVTVIFDEFDRILSEKPFQLRVDNLKLNVTVNQQQILSVLRYLEPITLTYFWVNPPERNERNNRRLGFDEIVQLEQWMGLESVHILDFEIEIPQEKWSHFNEVHISLTAPPTESIVRILEKFLLKPTLKRLWLRWSGGDLDTTRLKEYVNQFEKIPERSQGGACLRLPYEGNNIVYFAFNLWSVTIQRQPLPVYRSEYRSLPL